MVSAAQVTDLYQGKAPTSGDMTAAQSQALGEVLVKVTGRRDILTQPEVAKALASPEVKDRFLKLGADAWTLKPEQFDAYIKDEITSNARLVKAAGLSPTP